MFDNVAIATALGVQGFVHGDEYRAKCPLHNDNNPSFSMNAVTGLWICHSGCGKGDIIRLVEMVLDCGPQEAHDWVRSNGTGTSVEQLSQTLARELGQLSQQESILAPPVAWFERYCQLSSNAMPLWFLNRGFSWKTITQWNIRYDPIDDAVILPVYWEEKLVGTVTRNTRQYLPKYQNSDGLPKSKILFGEITSASKEIIICEGVLDALWLWQLGYNAVSILGSSLSSSQVDILRRYRFGEIILCLDNDEAGKHGTVEAYNLLVTSGWLLPQIRIIDFPGRNPEDPEYRKDAQDCNEELFDTLYKNRRGVIYGFHL